MEWIINFEEKSESQLEWIEKTKHELLEIKIKKYKDEFWYKNEGFIYQLHCHGKLWEIQHDIPLPEGVFEGVYGSFDFEVFRSNDLEAIIELSEELKRRAEEEEEEEAFA